METRRIYLSPINGTRYKHRTWLEYTPPSVGPFYWSQVRRNYRLLRTAGIEPSIARWCIYDLLLVGRNVERCTNYGQAR
jgi:hypothetical protein